MTDRPWKEQFVTIPVEGEGLVLEGVWQAGEERAAVVAPPHPEFGGSLDNPVVNEIAYALYTEGFASLRFNWRGVGGSQGRISGDPTAAEVDYEAALSHLHQTLQVPITAAGYSFGAATAVRLALRDPRIRRVILVAPPARMIESLPLADLALPVRVIAGAEDPYAPAAALADALDPVPDGDLKLIPDVDHFFASGGLAELNELVRAAVSPRA